MLGLCLVRARRAPGDNQTDHTMPPKGGSLRPTPRRRHAIFFIFNLLRVRSRAAVAAARSRLNK